MLVVSTKRISTCWISKGDQCLLDPQRGSVLVESKSQSIFISTIWPKAQCTTILQINLVILNLQLISFSHSLHDK